MRNVDVEKGSKYNATIEATKTLHSNVPSYLLAAAVGITITLIAWWGYTHVFGGCFGIKGFFQHCSVVIT